MKGLRLSPVQVGKRQVVESTEGPREPHGPLRPEENARGERRFPRTLGRTCESSPSSGSEAYTSREEDMGGAELFDLRLYHWGLDTCEV